MIGNGASGAYFDISGEIANNATWQEIIYFMSAGVPMVLTGLAFQMTFRCVGDSTSSNFTLSTAAGTLVIQNDADSGVANNLAINASAGTLSGLSGDYVCDLASKDVAGVLTAWAHGTVSFRPNPVSF